MFHVELSNISRETFKHVEKGVGKMDFLLDASKITEFSICEMKFFLEYVKYWKKGGNFHADFGSILHGGMEIVFLNWYQVKLIDFAFFDKAINEFKDYDIDFESYIIYILTRNDLLKAVYERLLKEQKSYQWEESEYYPAKTIFKCFLIIVKFIRKYQFEKFEVLEFEGEQAVEIGFKFDGFGGRFDIVLDGGEWIQPLDFKTASGNYMAPDWIQSYDRTWQAGLYSLAAKRLAEKLGKEWKPLKIARFQFKDLKFTKADLSDPYRHGVVDIKETLWNNHRLRIFEKTLEEKALRILWKVREWKKKKLCWFLRDMTVCGNFYGKPCSWVDICSVCDRIEEMKAPWGVGVSKWHPHNGIEKVIEL
jgi:hypothetical protein